MKKLLLILIFSLPLVSCENLYEEMAAKDSEDAILYSARIALSKGLWTEALSEFARLSTTTLEQPDVVVDRASAYSGRCGLDFLDLSETIDEIGTTPIFELLIDSFIADDASNLADCKLSEDLLKTISDTDGVVSTERGQFLMAFNSFAKIGVILNHRGDTNDDGAPDAGWDPCDANGATDLPATDVSEIGTAVVLFYKNMQEHSFGESITQSIDDVCVAIDGTPYDFCDGINIADFTDEHRELIRGMIRETSDGIGLGISAGGVAANACEP